MEIECALDELARLMQRILGIIRDGRRSLQTAEATQWKALALARWEMLAALDRFVTFKRERVLEPLIRRANPEIEHRAARLMATNEALQHAFDEFVEHYALVSPLGVHDHYRREAMAMADRIEQQILNDAQELEQLILAPRG